MNDNRLPIPAGTEITDYHAGKAVTFSVADVIGCGGSCIAYNAFYTDAYGIRHDGVLKQLHPLGTESPSRWDEVQVSEEMLKRFLDAAALQKNVGQHAETVNATSMLRTVFSYRDSLYFQFSEKLSGTSLDHIHFDTLHGFLSVLSQAAEIVCAYHAQGWLYLDLKPSNLFCRSEGNGKYAVSMFDFDSMIPLEQVTDLAQVLSCSKEYAAPELVRGNRSQIGISSDFFSFGCMLFAWGFGRLPKSTEISGFCRYRFEESRLNDCRNPELLAALQDFFKHTLTVNVRSRFSSDAEFRQALDNLCVLSKEKTRSIISNFTTPATFFTGRAAETEAIRSKLSECGRVILQGVGGIGKSSLALHYADAARKAYQTIVYLEYHGSFADMAEDIAIDGVSQNLSAKEKLKILRELCSEKTLVILDNLDGMEHAELEADWLSLPCHLIMTARGSAEKYRDITLSLSGLREAQTLFYHYYTLPCTADEKNIVDELLYTINSHTMMTELLGKFCCHYGATHEHSNLAEVCDAFRQMRTAHVGTERVRQVKDWMPENHSLQMHMDILFSVFSFQPEEKYLLKFLSLTALKSVSRAFLETWCKVDCTSALEKMKALGVIQSGGEESYRLHPLIADRVLFNYPPQAGEFSFPTEKLTGALLNADSHNRRTLLAMATHYAAHLQGTNRSLVLLYQTLAARLPRKQVQPWMEKAEEMSSAVMGADAVPYFLQLKAIAVRFSGLMWFDDEEAAEKEQLMDQFAAICEAALRKLPEYGLTLNCELIAEVCETLFHEDMTCAHSEKSVMFPQYQVKFLEKAFSQCHEDTEKKRIAEKLYRCYNECFSPVEDAVKAEQYRNIGEIGIRIGGKRVDSDPQEQDANLISAMRIEHQYCDALAIANKWYQKYQNESIPLNAYLHFQMEQLYGETHWWTRHLRLVQDDGKIEGYSNLLSLGKTYYHMKNYPKAAATLQEAVRFYAKDKSEELNRQTEDYLLSLGYLAASQLMGHTAEESEQTFFTQAEKYYGCSLMQSSDELAEFCRSMCQRYLRKISISQAVSFLGQYLKWTNQTAGEKAARFLKLYARFRDVDFVEAQEYEKFADTLEQCETAQNFFWIRFYQARYWQRTERADAAMRWYLAMLSALETQRDIPPETKACYRQLVYQQVENCDFAYFLEHFRSKIDYELLSQMEQPGGDASCTFDEMVRERLSVARNYQRIHSPRGEQILQQVRSDVAQFSGDAAVHENALLQLERYFSKDVDTALEYARKRYEVCQKLHDPVKHIEICTDIAHDYYRKSDRAAQLRWLQKAQEPPTLPGEKEKRQYAEQMVMVHQSLLAFYEEGGDLEMQIQENRCLEKLCTSLQGKRYERELAKVYGNLSRLFLECHNPTQAYFYKALEEETVQRSFV